MIKQFFYRYLELVFWITGLTALAFADPIKQAHFTLCPLKLLGFTWCPGCGLGHSIMFLLRGDIKESFNAHWLGIPAFFTILSRIHDLAKDRWNIFNFEALQHR